MEYNAEELRAYINAFNSIHVDTPEEHNEMTEILHRLGFKIGYPNVRFKKFHYISLGNIERDCMRELSREFPDILFTLHCDGMSLDDTWDAGFCDGRSDVQYAYIPDLNKAYLITGKEPETWC